MTKNILRILFVLVILAEALLFFSFALAFSNLPIVTTDSASSITKNSALLRGKVNPSGLQTYTWFEVGESPYVDFIFGNTLLTNSQSMGVGSEEVSFSQSISGLKPNTTYYYRAVASNPAGKSYGQILTFITSPFYALGNLATPPFVTTQAPDLITENSAILKGMVNPNLQTTYAWFEYGISPSLIKSTTPKQFISPQLTLEFGQTLSNLQPNTTYYYRAVAENSVGKSQGQIFNFTTRFSSISQKPVMETEKTETSLPLVKPEIISQKVIEKVAEKELEKPAEEEIAQKEEGGLASILEASKNLIKNNWLYLILILILGMIIFYFLFFKKRAT